MIKFTNSWTQWWRDTGGVIGITENETALRRWMVAGPETARLVMEYEEKHSKIKKESECHREQIPSMQKTSFLAQTKNVTEMTEELGNPFADTQTDLYTLDSKLIMPDSVVHTIRTAEDTGKAQHQTFVAERLNSNIAAVNDTVHKNNLPWLTSKSGKKLTKATFKICNLQNDVHLFSMISTVGRRG